MTLRVAYLINQYPKVSHSFIRREIQALERQGVHVARWAIRGWDGVLADDADQAERAQTRYVLEVGGLSLLRSMARALWRRPMAFFKAGVQATRAGWRADRPLTVHWIYWAEACLVDEWLRHEKIDHVHAHFGTNAAQVAQLVSVLGSASYSFTVHGPEEFDKPKALHLADKIQQAAFVVAISSFGRSQLWRWLDRGQWGKVQVVHCGLEPGFHSDADRFTSNSARLVCVGRLCEQKGQLLLLQAAARLIQEGLTFELVLAGDGEMRPEVEALMDELHLRDHVRITGWISSERVRSELLSARALVLPSFAEGLPVVLMEAMVLRRPVISTFVAGIPELVREGHEGWLVPAGDSEALVQALRACLEASAETLQRMGRSAHARVLARHDIDQEARKLRQLFEERAQHPPNRRLS